MGIFDVYSTKNRIKFHKDLDYYQSIPSHSTQTYFESFGQPEFIQKPVKIQSTRKEMQLLNKFLTNNPEYSAVSVPTEFFKTNLKINISAEKMGSSIIQAKKLLLPVIDTKTPTRRVIVVLEDEDEKAKTYSIRYNNKKDDPRSLLKKIKRILNGTSKSRKISLNQYINWSESATPLKFIHKKSENFLQSRKLNHQNLIEKKSVSSSSDQNHNQEFQHIRRQEIQCDCRLENRYIDLGNYINGALGYVNIGQCTGSCNGRAFNSCEESAHTRFKRMLRHAYGARELPGNSKLELSCVPTEFRSVTLPMKLRDGSFKMEEFKTMKATKCGCR